MADGEGGRSSQWCNGRSILATDNVAFCGSFASLSIYDIACLYSGIIGGALVYYKFYAEGVVMSLL